MVTYTIYKHINEDEETNKFPHFHKSETTSSSGAEDLRINEEFFKSQYQRMLSKEIELSKSIKTKKKQFFPSYAKLELLLFLSLGLFLIFLSLISIPMVGISATGLYFLLIGIGCFILFFPLLHLSKRVV